MNMLLSLKRLKGWFCSLQTRVNRVSPTNVSSKPPRPVGYLTQSGNLLVTIMIVLNFAMQRRRSSIQALLPPQDMDDEGKPLLVLGLDGTLVHSSLEKVGVHILIYDISITTLLFMLENAAGR